MADDLAIKEARLQLERRFILVDSILNLGFKEFVVYTGRICVPYIPTHDFKDRIEKELMFLRYEDLDAVKGGTDKNICLSFQSIPSLFLVETPPTTIWD